jgi:hypothetical protein
MSERNKENQNHLHIQETSLALASENDEIIIKKIFELKAIGNFTILPLVLDLLNSAKSERVRKEVLEFLSELKDQKCVPVINDFILNSKSEEHLSEVIITCWQSGLDYSRHLKTFAGCFITGNYQVAIESFTVIEEMIWKSSKNKIIECSTFLLDRIKEISNEKKLLFDELIKILNEGLSHNEIDTHQFS